MKKLAIAFAALALTLPTSANAEVMEWVRQAHQKLQYEFGYGDEDGVIFLRSFAYQLSPTQYWDMTISPQATGRVYVSAACDDDCTGMSFDVSDSNGRPVYTRWHRSNSIYFDAEEGQSYQIRYRLNSCDAPFCFALGLAYQRVE